MIKSCDICSENEHKSFLTLVGDFFLCKSCIANFAADDVIFSCKCGEWDIKTVKTLLSGGDSFIKCMECNCEIIGVYSEKDHEKDNDKEEISKIVYCDCGEWDKEKLERIKPLIGAYCSDCGVIIKERFNEEMDGCYNSLEGVMSVCKNKLYDTVNHPPHYKSGGMEVIDVIEAFKLGFPLGNAVKYILRAGKKDSGLQDLQKAAWYITHEINKIIKSTVLKRDDNGF